MKNRDVVRSATRVLHLLEALNRHQTASVAQLQTITGLPKATIVRLTHTLLSEGYLRKVSRAAGYALTERVLNLSAGFRHTDLVVAVARAPLDAFTAEHKWLCGLQTYDRGAMRGRYATTETSPLASDPPTIHRRTPILTTAHGQAYLAFCGAAEREMILAMLRASENAANTPSLDLDFVAEMVAKVQRQGYALRSATPGDRVKGFAVPVMEAGGVAASIGMRYFASAMTPSEAVARYLPALQEVAAEISAALAEAKAGAISAGPLST